MTFKGFRQIPEWADDEIFTITGKQLRAVQDMFKAYTPFTQAMEPVFVENLDNGKIKIRYEDVDGNPMTQEEVQTMLDEYAKAMVSQMKQKEEGAQ